MAKIVSKAQHRWWFANHPRKAKDIAVAGKYKGLPARIGKKGGKKK